MRIKLILIAFLLFFLSACGATRPPVPVGVIPKTKPVTNAEEQYGHKVLQEMSKKWPLDYDDPRLTTVQKIVEKLTAAAGADQQPWHVYLFKAPKVKNAAATRGNHVFVWSGMLDWIKNDDELATILGHELAHVLARHTDPDPNEEAKNILIRLGAIAAAVAVSQGVDGGQTGANLGNMAAAMTEQLAKGVLVNPYSRQLEHEADHIGLMIMSEAQFNPNRALDFWRRAESDPSFGGKTAFFSTHPPAADRVKNLQEAMPKAKSRLKGAGAKKLLPDPKQSSKKSELKKTDSKQAKSKKEEPTVLAQQWTDKYYDSKNSGRELKQPKIVESKESDAKEAKNATSKFDMRPDSSKKLPTFAIGSPDKQIDISNIERKSPQDKDFRNQWKVVSSRAFLYGKPETGSKRLGEIRRGGLVSVIDDLGDWLRISKPDFGYIAKSDLAPLGKN